MIHGMDRISTGTPEPAPQAAQPAPATQALGAVGSPTGERAVRILAKSIHRDLSSNGWEAEDVMALASELLSSVARQMRTRRS